MTIFDYSLSADYGRPWDCNLKYLQISVLNFVGRDPENDEDYYETSLGCIYGWSNMENVSDDVPLTNVILTGGTTIESYAFSYFKSLTSITLPSSITKIEDFAFYYCEGLKTITIPNGVTDIGGAAFEFCYGLTGNLTIPNNVTNIGYEAFDCCSGLTGNLVIPSSVTSIGVWAFYGCSGFTGNLIIPSSVTSIGDYTFYGCSGFTGLTIPNASIYDAAFGDCSGLKSVTIGEGVTKIRDSAFSGCSNLTEVTIESEYVYTNATTETECGDLLYYATKIKVLSSLVADGHAYINKTNFPNVSTERIDGKDYTVYRK